MYLLDTNVVSELRKPRPHGAAAAWLAGLDNPSVHLGAVTIGELQAGVEKTRDSDPGRAAELESWLDRVADTWNVLALDAQTLRIWAKLVHHKSPHLIEDALIAATAKRHGLTVATRNTKDFTGFGVPLVNPFEAPDAASPSAGDMRQS
jgi:predicted nucleic acid-binding protein